MEGAQFLWQPPGESGRIVSMIQWHDHIIIACEHALYRVRQKDGDDVTVEELDMKSDQDRYDSVSVTGSGRRV